MLAFFDGQRHLKDRREKCAENISKSLGLNAQQGLPSGGIANAIAHDRSSCLVRQ